MDFESIYYNTIPIIIMPKTYNVGLINSNTSSNNISILDSSNTGYVINQVYNVNRYYLGEGVYNFTTTTPIGFVIGSPDNVIITLVSGETNLYNTNSNSTTCIPLGASIIHYTGTITIEVIGDFKYIYYHDYNSGWGGGFNSPIIYVKNIFNNSTFAGSSISNKTFLKNNFINNSNFTGISLHNVNLQNSLINNTPLQNSVIDNNSNFSNAIFENIIFTSSTITSAQFENCLFDNVRFDSINIGYSQTITITFSHSKFNTVDFSHSNLKEVDFSYCTFTNCTFNTTILDYANFEYASMTNCIFINSTINYSNFYKLTSSGLTLDNSFISSLPTGYGTIITGYTPAPTSDPPSPDIPLYTLIGPGIDISTLDFSNTNMSNINVSGCIFYNSTNNTTTGLLNIFTSGLLYSSINPPILPTNFAIIDGVLVGPYVNISNTRFISSNFSQVDLTGVNAVGATFNVNTIFKSNTLFQLINGQLVGPYIKVNTYTFRQYDLTGKI